MWHLAAASNIPAIFMMKRMADLALDDAARVSGIHVFQAIWTAVLFINCQLDLRLVTQEVPSLGS